MTMRGPDWIRMRPAVVFLSNDADGCLRMFLELFDYAIQEHQLGYVSRITVTKLPDGSYIIEDDGCGMPMEYNHEKGIYDWEDTFLGKRPQTSCDPIDLVLNNERKRALRSAVRCDRYVPWYALFAGTAVSRYMNANVFRDGCEYTLHFEKGQLVRPMNKIPCGNHKHGTRLHFLPDDDVFSSTAFDYANVVEYAAEQAAFNPGLTLIVKDLCKCPVRERTFCYTNGFAEMLADKLGDNISPKRFCWETVVDDEMVKKYRPADNRDWISDGFEMNPPYAVRFEVAFAYSPEKNLRGYFYNYKRLEHGGVLRTAVTESINKVQAVSAERDIVTDGIFENISIYVSVISERTSWDTGRQTGIANSGICNRLEPILCQLLLAYIEELSSAKLLK